MFIFFIVDVKQKKLRKSSYKPPLADHRFKMPLNTSKLEYTFNHQHEKTGSHIEIRKTPQQRFSIL